MVGWIKMKLGTKVGLGRGHIMFDGDPAPLPKRAQTNNFRPMMVCCVILQEQSKPIGSSGTVVEIDGTKFRKRKFNRGKQEGQHLLTGQRAANFRLLANQ